MSNRFSSSSGSVSSTALGKNSSDSLLVELFTEELPPKSLKKLSDSFTKSIVDQLIAQGLATSDVVATSFATPRRLAVHLNSVLSVSADKAVREKLLPVSIALDAEGKPTAPLLKKLAALGHENYPLEKLERSGEGNKNEAFYLNATQAGIPLSVGLQVALDYALSKLPIAKTMNYQLSPGTKDEVDAHFVRPAHGLVALHGSAVVPVSVLGLAASNTTLGHRFLSKPASHVNSGDLSGERVELKSASSYEEALDKVKVVASFERRRERIKQGLLAAAGKNQVLMPDILLDEVCSLVEWPVVYTCEFEPEFLEVPQECLILTMQTNQKYFAMTDASGKLVNQFLIVSNIETPTPEAIISGNERVVRPRLADARFFFSQDRKKKLIDRVPDLAKVVYHNKLGNQLQRVKRVRLIAKRIAGLLIERGLASSNSGSLADLAERAALLAKADLLTDMVGEFPELQGIMGTYYAKHDGEHPDVAAACTEHYQPRFAGDTLPATMTGLVLALADKLETLVGIWGIGLHPTGEKDPFALRRHALGICRLLIEKNLPLSLAELIEIAREHFSSTEVLENASIDKVHSFILDRLRSYLKDSKGLGLDLDLDSDSSLSSIAYSTEEIESVLSDSPALISDLPKRLVAVREFLSLPEASSLAAANKRISNILKKVEGGLPSQVNASLLSIPAEKALAQGIDELIPVIQKAFEKQDFTGALKSLATISSAVSAFFEDVMVMDPDPKLRDNRLALLSTLHREMNRVADLSKLAK